MKIFFLTTELSVKNGWGRYSIDLLTMLRSSGLETIVAMSYLGPSEVPWTVIKKLPSPTDYLKIYPLAIWSAWKLRKSVAGCEAIHCLVEPYSAIAYWLSKFTGKKFYITTHGTFGILPYEFPLWQRYFHHRSFRVADQIICVSSYTKKRLARFGLRNLVVINNGIVFSNFHKPPIPLLKEREDVILSVGAFKKRKGQHLSLVAFAKVANQFPNLKYYLVGDKSDKEYFSRLLNLAKELGVEKRTRFLSDVSDEELLVLYKRAKLFILSSLSEKSYFEGFGLVYLEANACGLPVIGSKDSGAEDAIINGQTGFLVSQNKPDIIAALIKEILNNDRLWQEISDGGIVRAQKFDWREIAKKYIEFYRMSICS